MICEECDENNDLMYYKVKVRHENKEKILCTVCVDSLWNSLGRVIEKMELIYFDKKHISEISIDKK